MSVKIVVGGVPEHFNIPWHQAIESGEFENNGIDLQWKDYPGGTGAMCADLRSSNLDVAVLLTEGIVADITKGNPSKIIQLYVKSPLIWGIHVPTTSSIKKVDGIEGRKYAISRLGSGSHLMSYVDANLRGWTISNDQFQIVQNLDGARNAFKNKEAEVFLWEKFMTKPYVDNGEFRRVGERPTPWPCFVIAAREEVIFKHPGEIKKLQEIISKASARFMYSKNAVETIVEKFHLKKEDAKEWFNSTRWATDSLMEKEILEGVNEYLFKLQLIDKKLSVDELCSFCELV